MRLRVSALLERVRSSLFFVPMFTLILAGALGFVTLAVDRHLDGGTRELPFGFTSTVKSARTLLGVVAGATISFAGIAFSVSLLIIQLASSQYSPRVVHTLFRDPFNKRVMALVVGTFTYCIVVLRSVRSALDEGGKSVIPNLSVAVAVVLGVATILAIVAFIDHSAHAMDVSEILERIRRETAEQIHAQWVAADPEVVDDVPLAYVEPGTVVRINRSGWVQQVDARAILDCLPAGSTAWVETFAGRYAVEHTRLCTITPVVDLDDELLERLHATIAIGETRTMQEDVSYGLRQLVDVAVKALSPGINDPTTAQDAIFHAAAVLSDFLHHDPQPRVSVDGSKRVVMVQQPSHRDLVRLAFDETRRAGASQPAVCLYLLGAIHSLIESLDAGGLDGRCDELRRQARLVVEGCGRSEVLDEDLDEVRQTYDRKFAHISSDRSGS